MVRLYVGGRWLEAGAAKLRSPAWMRQTGLFSLQPPGLHAAPSGAGAAHGYAGWLQAAWLGQPLFWSHLIAWGELAAGLGVLLGVLTGICAMFGILVDWHLPLMGVAAVDPVMLALAVALVLAWRVAGWWGLDRWLLGACGCTMPDRPG